MRKVSQEKIKVLLDGQGGDELLAGYERYYPLFFLELLRQGHWWKALQEFRFASKRSRLSLKKLAQYFLYFGFLPIRQWFVSRRSHVLQKSVVDRATARLGSYVPVKKRLLEYQVNEIEFWQLPHLLRYEDRNSMAFSIEARVPYLDHELVELGLSFSAEEKIRKGFSKYPLRLVTEKVLPKSIAWRTNKIGFEAPTQWWIPKHFAQMALEISSSNVLKRYLENRVSLKGVDIDLLWRLYSVAVWEKLFLKGSLER
jgi:asparagine synthase (glutamine-hydrolysing)